MASGWCRLYDDALSHPKWGVVARLLGEPLLFVHSLFLALMCIASRAKPRGSVAGASPDEIAVLMGGVDPATVARAIEILKLPDPATGRPRFIAADGKIANWSRRQPYREREAGPDLLDALNQPGTSPGAGANPAIPAGASPAGNGGASPPTGANPEPKDRAAMPGRRSNRPAAPQNIVVEKPSDTQKATSNHRQAKGNQSPPFPPAPPLTPPCSNYLNTPNPSLSPSDGIDRLRLAVWRSAGRSEAWIGTRLVSTSREGISEVRRWLGLGMSEDALIEAACDALRTAVAKGQQIGRPFAYADQAVMSLAARADQVAPDAVLPSDPWEARVANAQKFWLTTWGAKPGDVDCAAPKSILERYGYSPQPQERP